MRVYSIFESMDGEVNCQHTGCLTTFIRLAGCNLYCKYCDSKKAQSAIAGTEMSVETILTNIYSEGKVTITGGEPLLQRVEVNLLAQKLAGKGRFVTIETNGTLPISPFARLVTYIVDCKLGNSGHAEAINLHAFDGLRRGLDYVKFVISDRSDFEEATHAKKDLTGDGCGATFAFSPAYKVLDPKELLEWMWQAGLTDCVLNLQLHKLINLVEDQV